MFNNIGHKIKVLAKVICWIGIIASIIIAIYSFGQHKDAEGAYTLIVGPLSSWISSWVLYAFGQLVENTDTIKYILYRSEKEADHNDN